MASEEHNGLLVVGTGELASAVAEEFADGWEVAVMGRDLAAAAELAGRIGCANVVADVTEYSQVERAVDEAAMAVGGLSVVINTAALHSVGHLRDTDPDRMRDMMLVNGLGPMNLARASEPHLRASVAEEKTARFIHTGSVMYGAQPGKIAYQASKHAGEDFADIYAHDARKQRISVLNFRPGAMEQASKDETGRRAEQEGGLDPAEVAQTLRYISEFPPDIDVSRMEMTSLWRWAGRP